jgi:hypothetical protein
VNAMQPISAQLKAGCPHPAESMMRRVGARGLQHWRLGTGNSELPWKAGCPHPAIAKTGRRQ